MSIKRYKPLGSSMRKHHPAIKPQSNHPTEIISAKRPLIKIKKYRKSFIIIHTASELNITSV